MPADGRFDRLEARGRLVAAFCLVIVIVTLKQPPALAGALLLGAGLAIIQGITFGRMMHRLLHVEGFVVVLLVLLPLTSATGPFVDAGPVTLSLGGLALALTLAARLTAAALVILALVAGLSGLRLGHALSRLGLPSGLVQVMLFAIRYIGLIDSEAGRLREAMRLRGFKPAADLHSIRSYGHFVGQLLVRSAERAERVAEAMRCRGFCGRFPLLVEEEFTSADAAVTALLVGSAIALLALDRLA